MSISDYPERISISPTYRQKREDDFYLVDRKAFPGKGTEYVRADRIEELEERLKAATDDANEAEAYAGELEANLAKAVDALGEAIYLLAPDEEDIAKETGLHRIVTAYAELTGDKDE